MKYANALLLSLLTFGIPGCANEIQDSGDVIIENEEMRLIILSDGTASSLIHKPTGEECLMAFSIALDINYSPYDDVYKTNLLPVGDREFTADSVFLKDDQLTIRFDIVDIDVIVNVDIKPQYIHFMIKDIVYNENKSKQQPYRKFIVPRVDEVWFLRLPIRNRTNFGNILNVMWDDQLAVNLLGSDPYARVDSEQGEGYRILEAGSTNEVKLKGVGGCLVTTFTDRILDNIAQVEEDFALPQGVRNRRREESNSSTYWSSEVNPENIDKHIEYAKKAGFRTFYIKDSSFSKTRGHYEWRSEYPNGIKDLQAVVKKIEGAGLTPGFHILYNNAGTNDKYVTPIPDNRLNLRRHFTLAAPLDKDDTTIFIEENPLGVTLKEHCRVLKIGEELVSYSDYSSSVPYKFTGCNRGVFNTKPVSHSVGYKFGLLDLFVVDEDVIPKFVTYNQNTSIQQEVAERLAEIYQEAGFRFVYYDGSEMTHPPSWFNCSKAQWEVYKRLIPEPIFAGGSAMSHFSWHMLTRGNHYDSHSWAPEVMKESIKKFPAAQAPLMANNFTASTFGRYKYFVPAEDTVGIQPDMLEYLTSRAAAWDSPWILKGRLDELDAHPRTSDNLEVIRRWEEVKAQKWLTDEHKRMLRNLDQEHLLLVNKQKEFELVPYEQIEDVAKGINEVRAFVFIRNNELYVVYWHISEDKALVLPVGHEEITLLEELGQEMEVESGKDGNSVILPVGRRRYVKTDQISKKELVAAFRNADILD
jgi:hypothetical protein